MEFLRTGDPEKIKSPQKIARKVDFSEPRLYNAPSLHIVNFRGSAKRKTLAFLGKNPLLFPTQKKNKVWRVRVASTLSFIQALLC